MDTEEFKRLMYVWSRNFGWRRPREWDEDSSFGVGSGLALAIDRVKVGVGYKERIERLRERKVRCLERLARAENRKVDPADLVEHRCFGAETRSVRSEGFHPTVGMGVGTRNWSPDPEAEWIERYWLELHRISKTQAVVFSVEFRTRGNRRKEKVPRAGKALLTKLTRRQYERQLGLAIAWMKVALESTEGKLKLHELQNELTNALGPVIREALRRGLV